MDIYTSQGERMMKDLDQPLIPRMAHMHMPMKKPCSKREGQLSAHGHYLIGTGVWMNLGSPGLVASTSRQVSTLVSVCYAPKNASRLQRLKEQEVYSSL